MAILSLGLLLASLLCCSFSQAPGDGDPLCINEMIDGSPNTYLNYSARPVYPATVWPLMDSRDYVNLLLGRDAVWQQVDQDTNNTPEIATNVSLQNYLYGATYTAAMASSLLRHWGSDW